MNLAEKYSREQYVEYLNSFLPSFKKDYREVTSKSKLFKNITQLGSDSDLDIIILEVTLVGSLDKRLAITTDAFKLMKQYQSYRTLIVFRTENDEAWRLSLLTSKPTIENGEVTTKLSNPRRFSYVLGPSSKIATPYKYLVKNGPVKNFVELEERFSVEVVNNDFYKEIAKLYDRLVGAENIKPSLKFPGAKEASYQFAVRLIGRVVFCWFLREKHSTNGSPLVNKELLSGTAARAENYYHTILAPLFFEVLNKPMDKRASRFQTGDFGKVPYLNGGLFSPLYDDYYKFDTAIQQSVPGLVDVDGNWVRSFFDLLETYNFTVDENTSVDIDLSIDPEMLGRIFENLLARINPETGETVRKSTGSFYTPREIVEYMVDESLVQYLRRKTKIASNKLAALISYDLIDDVVNPLCEDEKKMVVRSLSKLTILDPACGSGAFPIGILQKIVFVLQQIDPDATLWFEEQIASAAKEVRDLIQREFEHKNFDYIRKLGIIRESIFGVDLQPIATEIARLRCFLTLIVDERVNDSEDNRGVYPLPNLEFKFVTANTLIELNIPNTKAAAAQSTLFEDREGIDELKKLRDDYFNSHDAERDALKFQFSQSQDRMLKNMIANNSHGVAGITHKLSTWDPFSHNETDWFDADWMFGIRDGFDIVIANPPYVRIHKQDASKKELMKKIYRSAVGDYDLYILFFERGINLLADGGVLTYITPDKYLVRDYGKVLREILLSKRILRLVDISRAEDAFQASTYPLISIIVNDKPAEEIYVTTVNSIKNIRDESKSTTLSHSAAQMNNIIEIINASDRLIMDKIYSTSSSLAEVISGNQLFCGTPRAKDYKVWGTRVVTGRDVTDKRLPLYVCASISPFRLNNNKMVRALGNKVVSPLFDNETNQITGQRWEDFSHKPKLLIRGNDTRITAALDTTGSVFVGVYAIKVESNISDIYLSILAQLNSKLLNWVYRVQNPSVRIGGGFFSINAPQIVKLPLIPASSPTNSRLNVLTERLIESYNTGADASATAGIQEQIDKEIYKYYALTPEEAKTIVGEIKG